MTQTLIYHYYTSLAMSNTLNWLARELVERVQKILESSGLKSRVIFVHCNGKLFLYKQLCTLCKQI